MSEFGRILATSAATAAMAGTAMFGLFAAPAQAAETDASSEIGIASSDDGACKTKKTVGNPIRLPSPLRPVHGFTGSRETTS